MRVCYVSPWDEPGAPAPVDLIDSRQTLREIANEMSARGHEVDVVQSFRLDVELLRDGVHYRFVRPAHWTRVLDAVARTARLLGRNWQFQANHRAASAAVNGSPDIVHIFGLNLDLDLWLTLRRARTRGIPLVAQYHGGLPPLSRVRRTLQRRNLRNVARALFTTIDHARPWLDSGLIAGISRVSTVMETSSCFRMTPRDEARRITGMRGDPVFLWVGRLQPDKDPMTVLRGFAKIVQARPGARLYLYFQRDDLLEELRALASRDRSVAEAVEFRGAVARSELEAVYNSADVFVIGSRHEVAGTAALEAMSCGVFPILPDIPSFRAMTADGRYGNLIEPGNDDDLATKALRIPLVDVSSLSTGIRDHFERELSYAAIARRLESIYREVLDERPSQENRGL